MNNTVFIKLYCNYADRVGRWVQKSADVINGWSIRLLGLSILLLPSLRGEIDFKPRSSRHALGFKGQGAV